MTLASSVEHQPRYTEIQCDKGFIYQASSLPDQLTPSQAIVSCQLSYTIVVIMNPRSLLQLLLTIPLQVLAIPLENSSPSIPSNPLRPRLGSVDACVREKISGPNGMAYQHFQVTENIHCGKAGCSVSKLNEHTFGVEASISIEGGYKEAGGSLGAGVVDEWTSGQQYQCNGDGDDTICVWVKVAYEKFEVAAHGATCDSGGPYEVKAPRKDNAGGEYYCVTGAKYCRSIESHYWE